MSANNVHDNQPEPWLRGVTPGVHPVTAHLLRSSEQIREDAARAITGLTTEQLWLQPDGKTSAGFHARHLAGSTRRLCAYLGGRPLTDSELAAIGAEREPGATAAELLAEIDVALAEYESLVRSLSPEAYGALRHVGRQRLPVTAISLAIHIAEHGQRHAGQARTLAKIAARR